MSKGSTVCQTTRRNEESPFSVPTDSMYIASPRQGRNHPTSSCWSSMFEISWVEMRYFVSFSPLAMPCSLESGAVTRLLGIRPSSAVASSTTGIRMFERYSVCETPPPAPSRSRISGRPWLFIARTDGEP